jgi:GNAT superfamily N-acetyltransferase
MTDYAAPPPTGPATPPDNRPAPDHPLLARFLAEFLGAWRDTDGLTVIGTAARTRPGWDGVVRAVVGVGHPRRGVISALPAAVGRPDAVVFHGTFRWTTAPAALPDVGTWVDVRDPRVPPWLHPFGGEALIAFEDGRYAAGVGVKRHNAYGLELSVGTEKRFRGRGLASRLVAQAARRVLALGAVPIYLHDPENVASDRTARTAGFPDLGWQIIGVANRLAGQSD